MEFTCNTKRLLAAVTACCRVAKRNGVKPILEQLRLTAEGDSVCIFATDLERSISLTVLSEVISAGSCLISSQKLRGALSQESSDTVNLTSCDSELRLKGDSSLIKWRTAEDLLPSVNEDKSAPTVVLQCGAIASALRAVSWSVDEASTRYTLGGVMFDCTGGETNFVATDGKAMAAFGPLQPPLKEASAIVPAGACAAVAAILPDEGDCEVCISNNDVHFRFEGGFFIARQLEGRFPRWRDAIPSCQELPIEIPTGILAAMVAKCMLVRTEGDATIERQVETAFSFDKGTLSISSKSETGEAQAESPVSCDRSITFHIDSAYVADSLRPMSPSENVEMLIVDEKTAVLFRQGILRCLIVPLH